MPDEKGKTKRWRTKFAATKRVIAADAPPSEDAKKALKFAITGATLTAAGFLMGLLTGANWLGMVVWPVSLPLAVIGGLRGKFEGDVIKAGRSPIRGKPLATTGMVLAACALAAAVAHLSTALLTEATTPSLPGEFGDPIKTYREYVRALREDDFEAYLACLSANRRYDRDTDGDGVNDTSSEEYEALLEKRFQVEREGRVKNELEILGGPEYSSGGTTALDARRADLYIRCLNKKINQSTDAKMTLKREDDGWKITATDL